MRLSFLFSWSYSIYAIRQCNHGISKGFVFLFSLSIFVMPSGASDVCNIIVRHLISRKNKALMFCFLIPRSSVITRDSTKHTSVRWVQTPDSQTCPFILKMRTVSCVQNRWGNVKGPFTNNGVGTWWKKITARLNYQLELLIRQMSNIYS